MVTVGVVSVGVEEGCVVVFVPMVDEKVDVGEVVVIDGVVVMD